MSRAGDRRYGGRAWITPGLLALAFGTFATAWAFTTPPFGYPDEADHYTRAIAVGRGDLWGEPNPQLTAPSFDTDPPRVCCDPGNPTASRWASEGTRVVSVPAPLLPERMPCSVGGAVPPAPCGRPIRGAEALEHLTSMGTIEPAMYVLPGLATRLTASPTTALRLGRFVNAAICTALLAAAAFALAGRSGDPTALLGLLTAATPLLLFIDGSISPSAVEIASGVAFFGLLLQGAREKAPPQGLWPQLALVGALLALSRSLGPVWIALDVMLIVALVGVERVRSRARAAPRAAGAAVAAVCAAVAVTVAWERAYQPGIDFDARYFVSRIRPALVDLAPLRSELVAVLGSPYAGWVVITALLCATALRLGSRRERAVLLGATALSVVAAVIVSAGVLNQNGFGLQARHVFALVATVPMLAGEVVHRHCDRLGAARAALLVAVVGVGAAASHAAAFVTAGRGFGWLDARHEGPALPPGGAAPWVLAIVAAILCVLAACAPLRVRPRTANPRAPDALMSD